MKRAALGIFLALTGLAAAPAARADCADEVRAARQRLPKVTDEARRRELALLLDKAEKDAKEGREKLCVEAVVRAQALAN